MQVKITTYWGNYILKKDYTSYYSFRQQSINSVEWENSGSNEFKMYSNDNIRLEVVLQRRSGNSSRI